MSDKTPEQVLSDIQETVHRIDKEVLGVAKDNTWMMRSINVLGKRIDDHERRIVHQEKVTGTNKTRTDYQEWGIRLLFGGVFSFAVYAIKLVVTASS